MSRGGWGTQGWASASAVSSAATLVWCVLRLHFWHSFFVVCEGDAIPGICCLRPPSLCFIFAFRRAGGSFNPFTLKKKKKVPSLCARNLYLPYTSCRSEVHCVRLFVPERHSSLTHVMERFHISLKSLHFRNLHFVYHFTVLTFLAGLCEALQMALQCHIYFHILLSAVR